MEIETVKNASIDSDEEAKKKAKKIHSAKKAVKLFESGVVENAYQDALKKAKQNPDEATKNFKISLIEDEQVKNMAIYKAAKRFLDNNCQQN